MILFISAILVVMLIVFLLNLYNFLALTKPVAADVLVVEGWLFDFMLDRAVDEIRKGNYRLILTTGVKKESNGDAAVTDTAGSAAYKLTQKGIDSALIAAIEGQDVNGHYTYHAALALKHWLTARPEITKLNVFTGGAHGRKSYNIYHRVLGKGITLGIISSAINHYNSQWWWGSARGIKSTIRYFFGYLYSVFWPFTD